MVLGLDAVVAKGVELAVAPSKDGQDGMSVASGANGDTVVPLPFASVPALPWADSLLFDLPLFLLFPEPLPLRPLGLWDPFTVLGLCDLLCDRSIGICQFHERSA